MGAQPPGGARDRCALVGAGGRALVGDAVPDAQSDVGRKGKRAARPIASVQETRRTSEDKPADGERACPRGSSGLSSPCAASLCSHCLEGRVLFQTRDSGCSMIAAFPAEESGKADVVCASGDDPARILTARLPRPRSRDRRQAPNRLRGADSRGQYTRRSAWVCVRITGRKTACYSRSAPTPPTS
jgi:hypothetical protein